MDGLEGISGSLTSGLGGETTGEAAAWLGGVITVGEGAGEGRGLGTGVEPSPVFFMFGETLPAFLSLYSSRAFFFMSLTTNAMAGEALPGNK